MGALTRECLAMRRKHRCICLTTRFPFCFYGFIALLLWAAAGFSTALHAQNFQPLTDVQQVAAGPDFTCALSMQGAVQCWGYNQYGQLGDGSTTDRLTGTHVTGLDRGVLAIAVGGSAATPTGFSCALLEDGRVKCWGWGAFGQMGNGTDDWHNPEPVVVQGLAQVQAIAAGGEHVCALRTNGQLWCWGANDFGQIGAGTFAAGKSLVPVQVASGIARFALGYSHTCVQLTSGLRCWGNNEQQQIGNDQPYSQLHFSPVDVLNLSDPVARVEGGRNFSCALTQAGRVHCWGRQANGQLGTGKQLYADPLPSNAVPGLGPGVRSISVGDQHACAVLQDRRLKCWGNNDRGQVGNNRHATHWRHDPVEVKGVSGAVQLALGADHACARLSGGGLRCWGDNSRGQLGLGPDEPKHWQHTPQPVVGLGATSHVTAGERHNCALTQSGNRMWCWGDNSILQLTEEFESVVSAPVAMDTLRDGPNLGNRSLTDIKAGGLITCVSTNLASVSAAACWGGPPWFGDYARVPNEMGTDILRIAAGWSHVCGVKQGGGLWCWGNNSRGQFGDNQYGSGNLFTAQRISAFDGDSVNLLAVGNDHGCAQTGGGVSCFGTYYSGRDHIPRISIQSLPGTVSALAAGKEHDCAISGGGAWCWGRNANGELGHEGDADTFNQAVPVAGLNSGVQKIAAGTGYSCAIVSGGKVRCWGYKRHGLLGDGQWTDAEPVPQIALGEAAVIFADRFEVR